MLFLLLVCITCVAISFVVLFVDLVLWCLGAWVLLLGCCLDFVYFVGLLLLGVGCWRIDLVAWVAALACVCGLPLWRVFVSLLLIVLLWWILLLCGELL